MIGAVVAFVAALASGLMLTPLARRYALRAGMVAKPASDRWHTEPTALLGGFAIGLAGVAGFVAGVTILSRGIEPSVIENLQTSRGLGVAAAALLMFVVGHTDDRKMTFFTTKLMMQLVAAALLVVSGAVFAVTPWPTANALLTVFWFVGITNAFNLIDNMDGVAAGVGAIAAVTLGIIAARSGAWIHTAAAWALAGASLGFLRYNFHPAKIFMGDAGSLFFGSALAGLLVTMPVSTAGPEIGRLIISATIVAVPLLDTSLVFITRTLAGRKFYHGARDHSTHRMARLGLSDRGVALAIYAIAALSGIVALIVVQLEHGLAPLLGLAFIVVLALGTMLIARATSDTRDKARDGVR